MNGMLLAMAYQQLTMGAFVDQTAAVGGDLGWRWMQSGDLVIAQAYGFQSHLRVGRHRTGLMEIHHLSGQLGVIGLEIAGHRGEYTDIQFPGWWDLIVDEGGSQSAAWQLHLHVLPTFASHGRNDLLPDGSPAQTYIGLGAGLGVEAAVAIGRMTLFGELTLRGRTRKHGENLPHGPARHELWADAQLGVRAGQWGITGWVQPYAQTNRKVLGDAPAHRTEFTGGVALQWRPFVQKRPVQDASAASAPSSP